MSEAKAPRIDPRFDPRFQRGYVPDAAADAARSSSEPRVPAPTAAPTGGPAAAVPAIAPATAPPATVDPAAAAAEVPPILPAGIPADPPAAEAAPVPDDERVLSDLFGRSTEEPSSFAPWFIAGWGVAVVATVIGVALWWAGIMTDGFSGPVRESDRWLQIVGWTVAPSLTEAGLLGLVAMLVWTGVRHARRQEDPS